MMKKNQRGPVKMPQRIFKCRSLTICIVLLQVTALQVAQTSAYSGDPSLPHYDPENQDGMPVVAPAIKWRYNDNDEDSTNHIPVSHRRNSEEDYGADDEEDDDRDDGYARSGSSRYDRYSEEPYGESAKAAKDGEDIEGFFDKHLGPQAAIEGNAEEERDVPINDIQPRGNVDPFEVAASSPLSSIFHSLLSGHKRPFVIHTTEEESPSSSSSTESSIQSTSSSTPVASSVRGYQAPIAYFSPIAAPSSMASYDQASAPGGQQVQEVGPSQGQEEYAPVREIYISRRPTMAMSNQFQAYSPQSQKLDYQSSNAYMRGAARPYQDDQADYARYPVAASYAYQREQQSAAPPAEEEQTVSFGLSFGRRPDASDESEGSPEEQSSADADSGGYDSPAYDSPRQLVGHSSRPYNYPMIASVGGYSQGRSQAAMMQQQPYHGARYHKDPSESEAQQVSYGQYSTQSYTQPILPNQHQIDHPDSGSSTSNNPVAKDTRWIARQHLLASLDKQIKTSSQYKQGAAAATTPGMLYAQQSGNSYTAQRLKMSPDSDVDTYSSYHSEVDPYKSFTTTSRIVSEPVTNNQRQYTGNRRPQGAGNYNINNNMQHQQQQQQYHHPQQSHQLLRQSPTSNSNPNLNRNLDTTTNQNSQGTVAASNSNERDSANLLTGPVNQVDSQRIQSMSTPESNQANQKSTEARHGILRVRREDSDDRENDDADDDGVWVDDDEDDDNKQQSSDLNETSQKPEDEENHQPDAIPPAVVRGHGYEIAPDDLIVYPG